jgi:branched-chain amino acid transport system substrate-binding protein
MTPRNARFLSVGVTAAIVTAGLAACSSSSSTSGGATSKSPILIGASLSTTGSFSADGQAFMRGYKLWAHDQNAKGGLLGHPIQFKFLNDNSDPNTAVSNYQTLITVDHVNLTIGPFSSLLTAPSVTVAHRYGFALVEGAGGSPAVFATKLPNVFDVSLPVAKSLQPLLSYLTSLPASQRPKTAAYPTVNDLFTTFQTAYAQQVLSAAGIRTVYPASKLFPTEPTQYKGIADQVARTKADVVVLGSLDVPTVQAFTQAFVQQHYNPKVFVATAGPDQGAAYVKAVGGGNTDGVLVPNTGYLGAPDPVRNAMQAEYVNLYHPSGGASGINADVYEAYSVGQVLTQAIEATHSTSNAKIIQYLHSGATMTSVQGPVKFDAVGENILATPEVFQWQKGKYVVVLPNVSGSVPIVYPKPAWGK